jgi:PBP1b-binding outer membrane lipoprotein LpoB
VYVRRVTKLSVVVSIVLLLGGCKKAANLANYKDRAAQLAAKYSPKLADLSKKLPDLAAHAKDLPVNVPGADKVGKLIADNKSTLDSAQDLLAKLPEKLAADTPEQAQKDLDAADKALAADVQTAEKDEQEEAKIEGAAAGSAGRSAGSGSAAH